MAGPSMNTTEKQEPCDTCYGRGCPVCQPERDFEAEIGNKDAPEGHVYVCMACGKQSNDKYGFKAISYGWDESCMMNAVLHPRSKCIIENGRVVKMND